jgi:transcriptional regulator with XRE-family HTH domain
MRYFSKPPKDFRKELSMSGLLSILSRARRQAGLTLGEIEKRTGVPASRLSLLLREEDAPDARLSTAESLADALEHEIFVVPKHLAPFVRQILETGGSIDEVRQAPSALEQALGFNPQEAEQMLGWGESAPSEEETGAQSGGPRARRFGPRSAR